MSLNLVVVSFISGNSLTRCDKLDRGLLVTSFEMSEILTFEETFGYFLRFLLRKRICMKTFDYDHVRPIQIMVFGNFMQGFWHFRKVQFLVQIFRSYFRLYILDPYNRFES